ncbi:CDC27 family protein [bacterium]|nr:CDC27 family protein [bacterium]
MSLNIPLPDDPKVTQHNGIVFTEVGAYAAAVPSLQHSLKFDPGNCRSMYYLALAHFRLGQYDSAVQAYNTLARSSDPESRPGCAMLQRAFTLRDGHHLRDVEELEENMALDMIERMYHSELQPIHFVGMVWLKEGQLRTARALDLSIIYGPENQFLCVLPQGQSWLEIETENAWVPVWRCPVSVFDRRAAQQLFFLRALFTLKSRFKLTTAPDVCSTEFPIEHRDILLQRIFPDSR